jgi:hypothetical protein
MQIPEHISCDVCGQPKGATNHWLIAITDPHPGTVGIAFGKLGQEVGDPDFKLEHLCGQACAHKRLSQWLDELNAPAPTTQQSEAA